MRLSGALGAGLAALALAGCEDITKPKVVAGCELEATRIYPNAYIEYPAARAFKLCMEREGYTMADWAGCGSFMVESCYRRKWLNILTF
jgi:hypothetical protein